MFFGRGVLVRLRVESGRSAMHSSRVLRSFIALLSVLAVTSVTRDASAQQGFAARFTSSGAKDTAFNNNTGRVLLSSAGGTTFYAVAPSGSGGFLLAGEQDKKFVVERLNSNGTPDTFFGPNGNGVVTADFSAFSGVTECVAFSVTADPGGGVIAAGTVTKDGWLTVAVAWWDAFGNPNAFGSNGTSLIRVAKGSPQHSMGTAVKVSGTNFLVGGYTLANTNVFVMRFNSSGNLDTTFGNASPKDGIARVPPVSGVTVPVARTMALDSMGRILLGGSARVSSQTTFAAWRLTSAGAVDNSFSSDGFNWFNPGANVAEVYAAAVDSSNRFVMGGAFNPPGQRFLTLVRVDSNGNRDTTFNAGTPAPGWKFVDISGSTDEVVYGLAIGSSGSIAVTGQQTTDKVFLDRFTSSGSDVGLTTQDVVANKGEGGFALMIDGSGGFVVAGGILKQ